MDLKTFVSATLEQIIAGVKTAQASEHGPQVAPETHLSGQGSFMNMGTMGAFTLVEFDVAVTAEAREGSPTLRVSSAEISGGPEHSTQSVSRVKFSVPVKLPPGSRLPRPSRHHDQDDDYNPFASTGDFNV